MKYVPPVGAAAGAPYVDASPGLGVEGDAVPAAAIEAPLRELDHLISAAGLMPSDGDLTQVYQAVQMLIAAAVGAISIKQKSVIATGQTFAPGVVDGDPIRWDAGNTRWAKALADGTANDLGLGLADVTNAEVVLYGETRAGLVAGLTPGAAYYLSATGTLAATPVADAVKVGVAKSATVLYVDFDPGASPQNANLVYAGPAAGAAALPTFRALAAADLPADLMDKGARDQLALTNLRQILNTGVSTGALVQGREWELSTDEWGSTSTNETYTAGSPNYYGNPGTTTSQPSSSSDWLGATGGFTYGAGSVTSIANDSHVRANTVTWAGDFEVSFQYSTVGGGANFGLLIVASEGSWSNSNSSTNFGISVASVMYNGTIYTGSTNTGQSLSLTTGEIYKFKRAGTTLELYEGGVLARTWSGVNQTLKFWIGTSNYTGGQFVATNLTYTVPGGSLNMTLIPPASISLAAAPAAADAYFLWKDDSGSAVLGTDLTVDLSRDDGTTWTAATLSNLIGSAGYDGTYTVIKARASLSGQPSGTSLTCRIKTLNTKAQRIGAPALYAE